MGIVYWMWCVNANKHNPLCTSYQTPNYAKESGNQRANRGQCVFYMISSCHSAPSSKMKRKYSHPHYSIVLNLAGIEFPITLIQIKKFETLNDISINVCTKRIVPIRLVDWKKNKHVNLLYIEDDNLGQSLRLSRIYFDWIAHNLAENNIRNISVIGT